ncbi:DMT family transporter [Pseudomonas sp. R2.Fl]|nr:DMT family transporter [Pseudomonas sp. R2.Fl]
MNAAKPAAQLRVGLAMTAFGGLILSFDVPLVRLGHGEAWSVIALRSISTFLVTIVVWSLLRLVTRRDIPLMPGWAGLGAGLCYGAATIAFLMSIYHTDAANAVFIIAFNPMLCALFAWLFLGERPSASTVATMVAMIGGVALIVAPGLSGGHMLGDGLAFLAALMLAAAITIGRATPRPLGFAPLIATVFPALIAGSIAVPRGVSIDNPGWIMLDGAVMMPVAFWCLATGPRYLPAAVVGMFYLLETVLAPVWMWLIFGEVPATATLIGGTIIVAALAAHSLRESIRRQAVTTEALAADLTRG